MKRIAILIVVAFLLLGIGYIPVRAETSLQRVRNYFTGRKRVTMAGVIAISGENKIYFKNEEGKLLRLRGRQAKNFLDKKGYTVEITGYLKKHDFEVRRYKIVKEYVEPEPEPEPEPESEPETTIDVDGYNNTDDTNTEVSGVNENLELDNNSEDVSYDVETYTVQSGDTLGKISKKFYGTVAKWKKIADDNGISDPRMLRVGQILKITKDE